MDRNDKDAADRFIEALACTGRLRRGRRWLTLILLALAAIILFLAMLPLEICRDCAFICENTGSQKGYRQWCIGWRSGQWYRESHLERFLRRQHLSELANRWTSYAGTGRNLLGRPVRFGHGLPQVDLIMTWPEAFDRCVDGLDDAARRDRYRVLVSVDPVPIRAEERKIADMVLAQPGAFR